MRIKAEKLAAQVTIHVAEPARERLFSEVTTLIEQALGVSAWVFMETPESGSTSADEFSRHVVSTGLPLRVDDVRQLSFELVVPEHDALGFRSYLGVPVVSSTDDVLAVVYVLDNSVRHWSDDQIEVLHKFSNTLSFALSGRQLVQQLFDANQRCANALNHTCSAVWFWRKGDDSIRWDTESGDLFGFSSHNYPRHLQELIQFTHESDQDRLLQALESINPSSDTYDIEVRIKGPLSPSYQWLRAHGHVTFDRHGEPEYAHGVLVDVNTLKHRERDSNTVEERFHHVFSQSNIAYAEYDSELNLRFANTAYAAIQKQSVDELIGKNVSEIIGFAWPMTEPKMRAALEGKSHTYTIDFTSDTADPEAQCMHITYRPIIDANGLVNSFSITILDITEQQSQTLRADLLEERLRVANQLSPDGFLIINALRNLQDGSLREFNIEYCNSAGAEFLGFSQEQIIGRTVRAILPKFISEGLHDEFEAVVDTGIAYQTVFRYVIRDIDLWIDVTAVKLTDGCAISIRDITESRKADAHRALLANELNHRVKNSLATIQAMARQTVRSSRDFDAFGSTFNARLSAMAAAHEILMATDYRHASLNTMIKRQVTPYVDDAGKQLIVNGCDVMLSGRCAHAIGLVLHELATNASKYGSLSNKTGHIEIDWTRIDSNDVIMSWQEVGGPPCTPPNRVGFGTLLIKQSLEYSQGGSASLNYNNDGLRAEFTIPAEQQYYD